MSGDGSTLFSRLRADGYGALALKWFCLLRHVRGVHWTISQSAEEREREREGERVWVAREMEKESQGERNEYSWVSKSYFAAWRGMWVCGGEGGYPAKVCHRHDFKSLI